MIVKMDTKAFMTKMNNIVEYSYGFLDGVERGKKTFLNNLGREVIFALGQYIDVNAKVNSSALHHVYEWYQTGSPSARLFDLDYTVSNLGLSINSKFKQSRTVSVDSNTPFYNKAYIMENGIPVVIKPKSTGVLAFEDGGQEIFTKRPVTVRNPGGDEVVGSFERVFDEFMTRYFRQSFLRSSGLFEYINNPIAYKKEFRAGSRMGRNKGVATGFKWIANARIGVN